MSKKVFYPAAIASIFCASAGVGSGELIAYWPLDEGAGAVAVDVVGGFDGTISGGSWLLPGKVGGAAYEGAGGNSIDCGTGPTPATDDLSLAWWMIDNHERWGTIMDKSEEGAGLGYNILVRPRTEDSPLRFRIGGWQGTYGGWAEECRVPVDAYNEGEWVHIVCTYDSETDTASIYVNGALPANGALNPKTGITGPGGYCQSVNHPDVPLFIRGGQEGFDGTLDDVAIWDHALTADEVMQVYLNGPLGVGARPPFEITAIDYTPGGDTVTLTWRSRAGATYIAKYSSDLTDWGADLGDGIGPGQDEVADDGDHITMTFDLAGFLLTDEEALYFRIEEEG